LSGLENPVPNLTDEPGPYETEEQALAASAVKAVYRAYRAGITSLHDGSVDLLLSACEKAGVVLGAYDRRILIWLAGFEPQAAAVVAGIINRAAARPPREVAFDVTVGDSAYFFLNQNPEEWSEQQRQLAINDLAHLVGLIELLAELTPQELRDMAEGIRQAAVLIIGGEA
jgi:hypothetical protein